MQTYAVNIEKRLFTVTEVPAPASVAQLTHQAKKSVEISGMHAALQMASNKILVK
jgi:hypothetical protein